jgi:hypothetical protein
MGCVRFAALLVLGFCLPLWAETTGSGNSAGAFSFDNPASGQTANRPAKRHRALANDPAISQYDTGNVVNAAPTPDDTSWWTPLNYRYSIGYEGNAFLSGVLPINTVVFGTWFNEHWGMEFYLGLSKPGDNYTESSSTFTDAVANSTTVTSAYTGTQTPTTVLLGVEPKYRLYQNNWLQISLGAVFAVSPPSSATYNVGQQQTTTTTATPNNSTVVDNAFGSATAHQDWQFNIGPKIGSEFYLKWFPHLALGFATGILATFGGYVTTTSTQRTAQYQVLSGQNQTANPDQTTNSSSTPKPGYRGTTFGIGGSVFEFTGLFTIRYVW